MSVGAIPVTLEPHPEWCFVACLTAIAPSKRMQQHAESSHNVHLGWRSQSRRRSYLSLSLYCQLCHSSFMPSPYFSFSLGAFIAHLLSQCCHLGPLLFLHHPLPLSHSCGMIQTRLLGIQVLEFPRRLKKISFRVCSTVSHPVATVAKAQCTQGLTHAVVLISFTWL